LPTPGTVSTLAERSTRPVFLTLPMPKEATPWAILSWGSVLPHGMSRGLRPWPLDQRAPLLGFSAPTALWEKGVHVSPVTRRAPRSCRGIRQRVPTRQLRCRSQVFPTSQRLLPPSAALPFSDRWRSWGSALQGFSSHAAPTARRRRHTLLTFLPSAGHPRFLGGVPRGAPAVNLGPTASAFFRLQGLRPRDSRSCHQVTVSVRAVDLPLLGLRLPMGSRDNEWTGLPPC
jgi:hypothetical protein